MFTSGLYEKISAETNVPKNTVKRVVESMTHVVLDTAKAGESIRIGTLGTIKPKYVKEHQANDPSKKGEKVKVYKFHRRKGYRRTQGHREQYQEIKFSKVQG